MDVELCAQMLALRAGSPARRLTQQIQAGQTGGQLSQTDATVLQDAQKLFWCLQVGSRLLSDKPLDPATLGWGATAFLLRETGAADVAALRLMLAQTAANVKGVIDALLSEG